MTLNMAKRPKVTTSAYSHTEGLESIIWLKINSEVEKTTVSAITTQEKRGEKALQEVIFNQFDLMILLNDENRYAIEYRLQRRSPLFLSTPRATSERRSRWRVFSLTPWITIEISLTDTSGCFFNIESIASTLS